MLDLIYICKYLAVQVATGLGDAGSLELETRVFITFGKIYL
jgi:hypothetical protein